MFLTILLAGCGTNMEATITGQVDGLSINTVTAYWGGPFIVFTNREMSCEDFAWVQKTTLDGDEPLTDYDVTALQITFNDTEVVTGTYDLSGQAPVKAEVIDITNSAMAVYKASAGNLLIEDLEEEGDAVGSFSFTYEEGGVLTGDFVLPWCNNLKSRV